MSSKQDKKKRKIWKRNMAALAGNDFRKYIQEMDMKLKIKDRIIIGLIVVILICFIIISILFFHI